MMVVLLKARRLQNGLGRVLEGKDGSWVPEIGSTCHEGQKEGI